MRITKGLVKISVRELVEFVLRSGSICSGVASSNRAVIGTLAHKKIQSSMEANYEAEVKLVHECQIEDISFVVEGRADGIIKDLISVTIDEIKTTAMPLSMVDENFNPLHWAQAKCYAYFYAKDKGLDEIQVRLTYYNIDTKEIKHLTKGFFFHELESFFNQLIHKYYKWVRFYRDWTEKRDGSLKDLAFPFENYRKGQREVAASVYRSIREGENLFVNAPTGIGKTISTLFPALKGIGEGLGSKIFYLTAKTITRTVAEEGIIRLQNKGAKIKSITLTAKDKICFCEKRQCTPDYCQWADGHYDRVDDATYEILNNKDLITREVVEAYARKHRVCPFELALDISIWTDVVICDYNYIFDPNAGLKRFADNSDFILLVDEAHNLVDRAREMYSAGLSKKQVLSVKKLLGKEYSAIKKELTKINEWLLDIKRTYVEEVGVYISKEPPKSLYKLLQRFLEACDQKLMEGGSDLPNELMELYFEAYHFNHCYELFDDHYVCYAEQSGSEVYYKEFCIDPSLAIRQITSTCKSAIFFSATLLPIDYFKDMLGGKEEKAYNFESPFNEYHALRMIAADVSTRYKDRESSLDLICDYIEKMITSKKGHYMVFFPSYKYMQDTYKHYLRKHEDEIISRPVQSIAPINTETSDIEANSLEGVRIRHSNHYVYTVYMQTGTMAEEEREAFLSHFEDRDAFTVNFCVLGGIFSEGIDLTGEKLIGVAVVGVGIPQIGLERDLIKHYFDQVEKEGYHYAYTYPGMNKVLQAVGRLIRTEEDRGVILLIDDRYRMSLYQNMLPHHYYLSRDKREFERGVGKFWEVTWEND